MNAKKLLETVTPKIMGRPPLEWTDKELAVIAILCEPILNGELSQRAVLRKVKEIIDGGSYISGLESKSINAIDLKTKEYTRSKR